MVWSETEEIDENGTKKLVRKPNPAFVAALEEIVPVVTPILIAKGKEQLQKMKFVGPDGAPAGGLGALVGQMLPGKMKQFGPLLEPFIQRFLGGLGGQKPAQAGSHELPDNPFLQRLK